MCDVIVACTKLTNSGLEIHEKFPLHEIYWSPLICAAVYWSPNEGGKHQQQGHCFSVPLAGGYKLNDSQGSQFSISQGGTLTPFQTF